MVILMVSAALYAIGLFLRTGESQRSFYIYHFLNLTRLEFAKDPHSTSKFLAMRLMVLLPAGGFYVLVRVTFRAIAGII
jgi:hypothetical protein